MSTPSSLVRHLSPLAALCLLAGALVGARAGAQAPPAAPAAPAMRRSVEEWPVARDTRLTLVAWPRGTPAPLELYVGKGKRDASRPPLDLASPVALRAEHVAARSWAIVVLGMFAPEDTSRFAANPWAVPLEGATAGTGLELVPLVRSGGVPDSVRLRLTSGGPTVELRLSAAEAWSIAWHFGELANVLDPEGTADYARVQLPSQVDRPAGSDRRSCAPRHPIERKRGRRAPETPEFGVVHVSFVIDTTGRVEPESLRILRLEGGFEFAQAVHDAVPCLRYRPAELRGRLVRVLAQQPFRFRVE